MRHLIRKLTASTMEISGQIKVGNDSVNVVSDGPRYHCMLNGYDVVSGDDGSFTTVVSDLVSRMFKQSKPRSVVVLRGPSEDQMQAVVERLKKELGEGKVSVKGLNGDGAKVVEPAELKLDDALNMDALSHNVGVLADKVATVASAVFQANDAAMMLTRKKIVESMWGAKEMQGILDGVRLKVDAGSPSMWTGVEVSNDMLSKSSVRLRRKLSSEDPDDGMMMASVLIPGVNDSYSKIKGMVSEAAVSVAPLVYIDDAFHKNTRYPASWFLSEEVMEKLASNYEALLGFMMQVPRIESKVIDPLSFVRMRIIDGTK